MFISSYLNVQLLNATLRNTAYTPVTPLYVALYTSNPGPTNTGVEVTGGAYARQTIAFGAPASNITLNTNLITFPTPLASWGTVGWAAIFDASTGGNLLYYFPLTVSFVIGIGVILNFAVGSISGKFDV